MAQLKDLLVNGPARIIGDVYFNKLPKYNNIELALNQTITITAGDGLSGGGNVKLNDDSRTIGISHASKPAAGNTKTNNAYKYTTIGSTSTIADAKKATTSVSQALSTGSRSYISHIDIDEHGHIAKVYTGAESDQDLTNYKTTQTAVTSPTSSTGNSTQFVDTLSQNSNGVISYTTKSVNFDKYALKSDIASAMRFKGTLGTKEDGATEQSLPTAVTGATGDTKGDMYKVITAGTYNGNTARVGDTFICNDSGVWVLIPSGDDPRVTQISAGTGLTTTSSSATSAGDPITSTGTLYIRKGGVGATQLASNAVTTVKIKDEQVTGGNSTTKGKIASNTIQLYNMNTNAYSKAGNRLGDVLVLSSGAGTIDSEQYNITSGATVKTEIKYDTDYQCLRFIFT